MIVSGDHKHATIFVTTKAVTVAHSISGSVDAGCFAIPHGINSIDLRVREKVNLLSTPHSGGCKIFIDAGLKHDAGIFHALFFAP